MDQEMPLVQSEVEVKTTSTPSDDGIMGWDWIEDFINYSSSEESDEDPIPKHLPAKTRAKAPNRKPRSTSKAPIKESRGKAGQYKPDGVRFPVNGLLFQILSIR